MSKPVVFVIGASGQVGLATVKVLLQKYGHEVEVRAGVRNPKTDKAKELEALKGLTVVQAEMGSDNLAQTLAGVEALYIVTPPAANRLELVVKTAEAAQKAGVRFALVISNTTVELDVFFGRQYREIEHSIGRSGLPHCFVRLPKFLENIKLEKPSIVRDSSVASPLSLYKKFAVVAVTDIAKASASILSNWERHSGKTYALASDEISYHDITVQLSSALQRPIRYVQMSYDEAKASLVAQGLPDWQADGTLENYRLIEAEVPQLSRGDISSVELLTGEGPTTLEMWVSINASFFAESKQKSV